MRNFSFQEILCIVLIGVYVVGIIIDIVKNQYKNFNFILSVGILLLTITITFFVAPAFVVGTSMEPTLHEKQVLVLNKFSRDFKKEDIVVLRSTTLKKSLIKRIVAEGGDTIYMDNGDLYVNDVLVDATYVTIPTVESFEKVVVPEGHYFVMGDNRPGSLDSRNDKVGFVEKKYVYGKIIQ